MTADRRKYERATVTGKLHVERLCGKSGRRAMLPIYLRDISAGGFSGTYFGEHADGSRHLYFAVHPRGTVSPLRLVWSRSTLETVHMLGFRLHDDGGERSGLQEYVLPVPG